MKQGHRDVTPQPLNLSRPVVALLLAALLTIVLVNAWDNFDPTASVPFLIFIGPLICLEGLYSAQLVAAQKLFSSDIKAFRFVELIGLGIGLKLLVALTSGEGLANLVVFDIRTAISLITGAFLWYSMLDTAADFKAIDQPLSAPLMGTSVYVAPVDRLTRRFLAGGLLMFVASVITIKAGASLSLVLPLLLYFVLGLLLLPSLRFQMERHRWQSFGIRASDAMIVPWVRAGAVLVVIACLGALLLPTSMGSGLWEMLNSIVSLIGYAIEFLILLLIWLLSLPFRLLLGNTVPPPPSLVNPHQPPPVNAPPPPPSPVLDWLPKLILVAVVAYIVISYFRDHPEFWGIFKKLRIIRFLTSVWHSIRYGAASLSQRLRLSIPSAIHLPFRRNTAIAIRAPNFVRVNGLPARERIRYFYLSTLRRAADQGVGRLPIQTPAEYGETLKDAIPETGEPLDALTEAFIEARYSAHLLNEEQAKRTETNWKQVRQAIQAIRKDG